MTTHHGLIIFVSGDSGIDDRMTFQPNKSSEPEKPNNELGSRVGKLISVKGHERRAVVWSFLWFFFVLSAYYFIRPVRETMGTVVGKEYLPQLFGSVFLLTLIASPIFSWATDRFSRQRLVPVVYRFFAAWLLGFSLIIYATVTPSFAIGFIFFIWVSVFNLFVVSLFWSVMVDVFSSEQGGRLFGLVSAAGSLGGLAASVTVAQVSDRIGVGLMLLIPILLMEMALFAAWRFERAVVADGLEVNVLVKPPTPAVKSAGIWTGLISVFRSPYLFGICLFLLLGKWCATTFYAELMGSVEANVADVGRRTTLFAQENLAVQLVAIVFQLFLTKQVLKLIGLPITLAVLPLAIGGGFLLMAYLPTLEVMFTLQVMQRSLAYGLLAPAREMLFTVTSQDEQYKSKSFIDTAVFRGGDAAATQVHRGISSAIKAGWLTVPIGMAMLPAAIAWAAIGLCLGRSQTKRAQRSRKGDY